MRIRIMNKKYFSGFLSALTSILLILPSSLFFLNLNTKANAASQVIAQDTFVRPNQSQWGTASDGQAWSGDANSANAFSIANNTGQVSNTGATSYNAILGPSSFDTEVLFTGSLSAYSSSN